jgi:redox-sensitive bicupin YhaK (pirin superfamily)
MARNKQVINVFQAGSKHWVGDGFPVRNLFPSNDLGQTISPFVLLDYAGPREFSPSAIPRGVREHPHRGFETVTILYQGEIDHRDSSGHSGHLDPGDVQWMTAGSGVVHEEMHGKTFTQQGGVFEAIQLWVNLPKSHKMDPPRYQDIPREKIPVMELSEGAGQLRVIAGEFLGVRGPARTYTPVNLGDLKLKGEKRIGLPLTSGYTSALFVLDGNLTLNENDKLHESELALLDPEGDQILIETDSDSRALLLNGAVIHEPMVQQGPFVMNSWGEILQAAQDYQTGKMGHLN